MKAARLPQISVFNRQRKIALDRAELEAFARRALPSCAREKGTGLTSLPQVDVLLISDRRISELHRRFMQIAGPTDVITFQHGEIFISVETAQRQAEAHRHVGGLRATPLSGSWIIALARLRRLGTDGATADALGAGENSCWR